MSNNPQWNNSRRVLERVFIRGSLQLETPASFGNGDAEGLLDIPLSYDPLDGTTPLLIGSSIAGALRNYLREYEHGFGWAEVTKARKKSSAERLFGHLDDSTDATEAEAKASVHSWLMVDDALGVFPKSGEITEIRDGVAINPKSRTAACDDAGKGQKFEVELLAAGTIFPIKLEFWLNEDNDDLLEPLALALQGLEQGKIGLGLRKQRGYGQCRVIDWEVCGYRMDQVDGFLNWLSHDNQTKGAQGTSILELLKVSPLSPHGGTTFLMEATFRLVDSLIIRSDSSSFNVLDTPDSRHLHSWREGQPRPVLPGTSLAGAIRARALRIAKTLIKGNNAEPLVDGMFGKGTTLQRDNPTGSRVIVYETLIKGGKVDRVQNRVKLDRFTSGAYPQALLSEQPLFATGSDPARVQVKLELRKTKKVEPRRFEAEVGLLLLVLKDLWTEDLSLGGESSIGRGRLQGEEAHLTLGEAGSLTNWTLTCKSEGRIEFGGNGNPTELQDRFLQALLQWEEVE